MKRIILQTTMIASFFALPGCQDIPGVLTVVKSFNVVIKGKTQTISPGAHKTSLDFKKNKVVAKIETGDATQKLELAVPDGSQIPDNGRFELKSAQTGQPFDVLGDVTTIITDSERRSGFESCQYQDYQQVCDQNGCHVIPINRFGQRSIEYFERQTRQEMKFEMKDAAVKLAAFDGQVNGSQRIVTSQGHCF